MGKGACEDKTVCIKDYALAVRPQDAHNCPIVRL